MVINLTTTRLSGSVAFATLYKVLLLGFLLGSKYLLLVKKM